MPVETVERTAMLGNTNKKAQWHYNIHNFIPYYTFIPKAVFGDLGFDWHLSVLVRCHQDVEPKPVQPFHLCKNFKC